MIHPQWTNIQYFDDLLYKLNKIIIEYNRILLIGDRTRINDYELRLRVHFNIDNDANLNDKLKSMKGNLQWNIVRLSPGRKFHE